MRHLAFSWWVQGLLVGGYRSSYVGLDPLGLADDPEGLEVVGLEQRVDVVQEELPQVGPDLEEAVV